MFKKIVSNLPFSPALVGQLAFYAKRLRDEEATRRLGLIFVALALVVQSLAVFQPPQSANASSPGDIVPGGIPGNSVSGLLGVYDNNSYNFRDIMNHVGITRSNLAATTLKSFVTGDKITWALTSHYSYSDGEREHKIYSSDGTFIKSVYSRPLSLSGNRTREFTGWVGKASFGWFAIRQSCGNLIADIIPPEPPKPCVYNSDITANDPNCKPCPYAPNLWINSPLCIEPVKPEPIKCIYNSNLLASDKDCRPCPYNILIWVNSPSCVEPPAKCKYNPAILANNPDCQQCPGNETIWIKDKSCVPNIIKTKSSKNITHGSVDATTLQAQPGDQISFTITIENTGTNSASSIKIDDNLSDVLEYATLTDNGGGTLNTATGTLSWPDISLNAKAKQTRTFSVKILDSVPATAQGSSNDTSFDCTIVNTFGNSVSIKIACPSPKIVEQVVTELPVTGPRENIIFSGIVLAVVVYFYTRSKQLGKEIRLIRKDANAGTI